jgi:hypothetical protein
MLTTSPLAPAVPQSVFRAVQLAGKNKEGRGWARILSTVLFGLCCFGTALDLRGGAIEVRALDVVVWLVALATTIQLWRPGSGPFYQKPLMLV